MSRVIEADDVVRSCVADPSRFRFTHQTSFVKRHLGLSSTPGVRWVVSTPTDRQLFAACSYR